MKRPRTQTYLKMEGELGDPEAFPISNRRPRGKWLEIYKAMAKSGKPYVLKIQPGDSSANVLINARGCIARFLDGQCRLECVVSTENNVSTLWMRLMRKDKPFLYYKEEKKS